MLYLFLENTVPMNSALHVAAGQERESIAGVHGQGGVLRLDPLPLVVDWVPDLERGDGLTEEEGETPEV